jgi:hypothetical protein
MARRGRKRRLDLESWPWQLILSGIGTFKACEIVGIGHRTGYRRRAENGGLPPARLAEQAHSGRFGSAYSRPPQNRADSAGRAPYPTATVAPNVARAVAIRARGDARRVNVPRRRAVGAASPAPTMRSASIRRPRRRVDHGGGGRYGRYVLWGCEPKLIRPEVRPRPAGGPAAWATRRGGRGPRRPRSIPGPGPGAVRR